MTDSAPAGDAAGEHDALLVDLDGVVHLGDEAIPAAGPSLDRARRAGLRVMFVTNNASRTAAEVAERLCRFGVHAEGDEVLTSSAVAADVLAGRHPAGARVLVVGGEGLRAPVEAAGLTPVASADDGPAAVVQGWSPELTWAQLAEAAVAIRAGADWIATNSDATLPSPRGPLPGNGSMVAALSTATGQEPLVVGKPAPAMFESARRLLGARAPLVVGDRLDTDIAGAVAAGLPSLLVLTGVSSLRDLLAAPGPQRPTYVGADLSAVTRPLVPILAAEVTGSADDVRRVIRAAWSGELSGQDYDDALRSLTLD